MLPLTLKCFILLLLSCCSLMRLLHSHSAAVLWPLESCRHSITVKRTGDGNGSGKPSDVLMMKFLLTLTHILEKCHSIYTPAEVKVNVACYDWTDEKLIICKKEREKNVKVKNITTTLPSNKTQELNTTLWKRLQTTVVV